MGINDNNSDKSILNILFEKFETEKKEAIKQFINFCDGCHKNPEDIPDKYKGFLDEEPNPVAGIGYGTSALTNDCRAKMKGKWTSSYAGLLSELKDNINSNDIDNLAKQVKEDRTKALNLFVNRCVITMNYKKLLAIADLKYLKQLRATLSEMGFKIKIDNQDDWLKLNETLFNFLKDLLKVNDNDNYKLAQLSLFGWYLKEKLLQIVIIQNTLKNNHNLILTGAPGTGKTFMAKEIAANIIGCKLDDLSENEQYGFVQFHPSYDYTDFVEGLRPNGSANGFERTNGIFKAFCEKAVNALKKEETKENKYVFIIDEINRGEISKIFGELFFSIDPGYRGTKGKVNTQYQNLIKEDDPFTNGFYVPENVYIIGTMNDIDRSVESMDFAFRRRFAFYEVTAEESKQILWKKDAWKDEIGVVDDKIMKNIPTLEKKMDALNNKILKPQYGLSPAYQIGASYFLKWKHYKDADKPYESLWKYHLEGLLFEYLRGKPNAQDLLESLKDTYDKAQ